MFKVVYTYYQKYQHERIFDSHAAAKKFFWYVQKRSGVTKVELTTV